MEIGRIRMSWNFIYEARKGFVVVLCEFVTSSLHIRKTEWRILRIKGHIVNIWTSEEGNGGWKKCALCWVEISCDARGKNGKCAQSLGTYERQRFGDLDVDGRITLICGNKMPTRCNRGFLLQILLLAQHVSGITMPIIRSSGVLYNGCCVWYFVLWFFK